LTWQCWFANNFQRPASTYRAENFNSIVCEYVCPGRNTGEGKLGRFGESG
jgi:hypothetical protein